MKANPNTLNLISAALFLLIAFGLDKATDALRKNAGATFDFQPSLWGQLGFVLLFGLLVFSFILITFVYLTPDRWVYASFLMASFFFLLIYIFTFPTQIISNISQNFSSLRTFLHSLVFLPGSFAGFSVSVMFWTAIGGLVLHKKSNQSPKRS